MNSAELKRAKRTVRTAVLASRDALPKVERDERGRRIVARVLGLPELSGSPCVMAFWSFGSEVDTIPLIEGLLTHGSRVALPRIVGGDIEARAYRSGDRVSPTSFGAYEPVAGAVLDPSTIDVIVTPGVAFDPRGGRVGYGGGFYDRFFRHTRPDALRAAVGFDLQLVTDPLPAGRFDVPLEVVVTESRTVRCVGAD